MVELEAELRQRLVTVIPQSLYVLCMVSTIASTTANPMALTSILLSLTLLSCPALSCPSCPLLSCPVPSSPTLPSLLLSCPLFSYPAFSSPVRPCSCLYLLGRTARPLQCSSGLTLQWFYSMTTSHTAHQTNTWRALQGMVQCISRGLSFNRTYGSNCSCTYPSHLYSASPTQSQILSTSYNSSAARSSRERCGYVRFSHL